jgi:hypothetical protein
MVNIILGYMAISSSYSNVSDKHVAPIFRIEIIQVRMRPSYKSSGRVCEFGKTVGRETPNNLYPGDRGRMLVRNVGIPLRCNNASQTTIPQFTAFTHACVAYLRTLKDVGT